MCNICPSFYRDPRPFTELPGKTGLHPETARQLHGVRLPSFAQVWLSIALVFHNCLCFLKRFCPCVRWSGRLAGFFSRTWAISFRPAKRVRAGRLRSGFARIRNGFAREHISFGSYVNLFAKRVFATCMVATMVILANSLNTFYW